MQGNEPQSSTISFDHVWAILSSKAEAHAFVEGLHKSVVFPVHLLRSSCLVDLGMAGGSVKNRNSYVSVWNVHPCFQLFYSFLPILPSFPVCGDIAHIGYYRMLDSKPRAGYFKHELGIQSYIAPQFQKVSTFSSIFIPVPLHIEKQVEKLVSPSTCLAPTAP